MTGESLPIEPLLKELSPQVLGILVRRHGQFDACEDAVQDALLAAAQQWPLDGIPDSPRSWLVTVANRRLVDEWRSESARRRRESEQFLLEADDSPLQHDDTLDLLFLCCHPALSEPSQLALTLRAVGGLTTAEIASAFLVPEATMAQRISRAKATIKAAGLDFGPPPVAERDERLRVVMHVLYLVFNEGYVTSSGEVATRADLTTEAIRLARMLHAAAPAETEVAGLLALMLLTDARRAARVSPDGSLVPLADQRRELWDAQRITEGIALVSRSLVVHRGDRGLQLVRPYGACAEGAADEGDALGDPLRIPEIPALGGERHE